MTEQIDNVKTLIDAGAAMVQVRAQDSGTPFVVAPEGYDIHSIERFLPTPKRKTGTVQTTDTDSFILYTKKHGSLVDCVIYADVDTEKSKCNLVAVINDYGNEPEWRDFRCAFTPKLSVEYLRWTSNNRVTMTQTDFATWLEDNLADIANVTNMPSGADILAMALGFEANAEKRLRSKINLQNGGVRFEFTEDEDKDTRTSMQVFERFTLGIPVFEGSASAYPIEARLKYREKSGTLTFWFELIRPDRVFKSSVNDELVKIKEATGFMLIYGRVE